MVIKYRKPNFSNILTEVLKDQTSKNESSDSKKKENMGTRGKERKIGEVIEKVALWRKLFSGVDVEGENFQVNLDNAANLVGLSKKTLDDYFLQIRFIS